MEIILKSSGLRTVDQFITRIIGKRGQIVPATWPVLATQRHTISVTGYLDGINPRQGPYRLVAFTMMKEMAPITKNFMSLASSMMTV